MMAARKKSSATSYYLISLDANPDDRGSNSVLGKLRGNAIGSQYTINDHGISFDKAVAPSTMRKELGLLRFEFDSGGPSSIEAWIPSVSQIGVPQILQPSAEADCIDNLVEKKTLDSRLMYLQNKKPRWDDAHGGHVLNFEGRVTESSVKNFQLCVSEPNGTEEVVLQFGRVGKNKFSLDVRFPLSPLQAFAISVACMDGKIADRKGYEYIKKWGGVGGGGGNDQGDSGDEGRGGGGAKRTSYSESIKQSLPSSQYLKDKLARSFK